MSQQFDFAALIGSRVKGLQEYAPEPMDKVAERLGLPVGQLIKLDANENPYGPCQSVMNKLNAYTEYHRYPDAVSSRLRDAIGAYINVDPATIIVGNGSDELIDLTVKVFRPGPTCHGQAGGGIAQIIDCPPTFGMYPFYGTTNDLQVITIPRDAQFKLDLDAIETLCAEDPSPKIIFATSPNNPDGQVLDEDSLERLLALPLLVILDEAYVEFGNISRATLVAQRDNLIVLRTFSKWAGLAGLRVGYGIYPAGLMQALWRLKSPYNVNGVAQAAALATLQHVDEALQSVQKLLDERQSLTTKLQEIPYLQVYQSQANFVLCRVRGLPVSVIREAMEARGIILRYYGSSGLEDCFRISVGTPMQDAALMMVLKGLVKSEARA